MVIALNVTNCATHVSGWHGSKLEPASLPL